MIGKLSSIEPLVKKLQLNSVDNYVLTEFVQGKTKRWGLAWSHLPFRMGRHPMTSTSSSLQKFKAKSAVRFITFTLRNPKTKEELIDDLIERLNQLSIPYRNRELGDLVILASRDTWTRKARRAREQSLNQSSHGNEIALCVRIDITLNQKDPQSNVLEAGWMYGRDSQLFESFVLSVLHGWTQQHLKPA